MKTNNNHFKELRCALDMPTAEADAWNNLKHHERALLCRSGGVKGERADWDFDELTVFERNCIKKAAVRLANWANRICDDFAGGKS